MSRVLQSATRSPVQEKENSGAAVHVDPAMKRVLIYRVGSLGDTLVALPAFHLVRKAFPRAQITLLSGLPVSAKAASIPSVLEHTGLIDRAMDFPIGLRDWSGVQELRHTLRGEQFDVVVHLAAARGLLKSLRDWAFFRSCGVRRIVGVPFRQRELRCVRGGPDDLGESEMERLLFRLRYLGQVDLRDALWVNLHLTAGEEAEAARQLASRQILTEFIVASVGTKLEIKDWTQPNWRTLIGQLGRQYPELGLVMIGSENERERSTEVLRGWLGPAANLCGVLPVRVSAALLKRARLFVGHDSGPMHLSATVGTSCVALFSARNPPGQWFPCGKNHTVFYRRTPCHGCELLECTTYQKQCLLGIAPAEVLRAIRNHLDAGGPAWSVEGPSQRNRTCSFSST